MYEFTFWFVDEYFGLFGYSLIIFYKLIKILKSDIFVYKNN